MSFSCFHAIHVEIDFSDECFREIGKLLLAWNDFLCELFELECLLRRTLL